MNKKWSCVFQKLQRTTTVFLICEETCIIVWFQPRPQSRLADFSQYHSSCQHITFPKTQPSTSQKWQKWYMALYTVLLMCCINHCNSSSDHECLHKALNRQSLETLMGLLERDYWAVPYSLVCTKPFTYTSWFRPHTTGKSASVLIGNPISHAFYRQIIQL